MNLLPISIERKLQRFPPGSQDGLGDQALVVVKYFFPAGRYTLFVTEADFFEGDVILFGYCISPLGPDCDEWGYQPLNELRATKVMGLRVERDLHFPVATVTVADATGCTAG